MSNHSLLVLLQLWGNSFSLGNIRTVSITCLDSGHGSIGIYIDHSPALADLEHQNGSDPQKAH